jgi:carboxymethylenebutenolidase
MNDKRSSGALEGSAVLSMMDPPDARAVAGKRRPLAFGLALFAIGALFAAVPGLWSPSGAAAQFPTLEERATLATPSSPPIPTLGGRAIQATPSSPAIPTLPGKPPASRTQEAQNRALEICSGFHASSPATSGALAARSLLTSPPLATATTGFPPTSPADGRVPAGRMATLPLTSTTASETPSSQPAKDTGAKPGAARVIKPPSEIGSPAVMVHPGSMVSIKSGSDTMQAYLSLPKGEGTHPGIVVIQEWWGLNDQIKSVADDLASKGYVALAPDLYRGRSTPDPQVAMELMRSLPEERAVADLHAAFGYLRSNPVVGSKPIGSIGFCMGGGYSLRLAIEEPALAASVVCYGRLVSDGTKIARISAPILGIFGGADQGIPQSMIDGFKTAMGDLRKKVDIKVYPDAGHGFMNPNNPGHKAEDTKDAWSRITVFFAENLKAR